MRRLSSIGKVYGVLMLALVALILMATQSANAATGSAQSDRLVPPAARSASAALNPELVITCTLATTTTDSLGNINHSFADAANLATYTGLALATGNKGAQVSPFEDYFVLSNASPNVTYTVDAIIDSSGNYNLGMIIYNASFVPVYTDTNAFDNNANLTVVFSTTSVTGPWYYRIFQLTPACSGGTYHLTPDETFPEATPAPTSTPTRTPTPTRTITPTPLPFSCQTGSDSFEPNNDFDSATTIGLDVKYGTSTGLNFKQCVYDENTWDNDFYKVRVKPGMLITCKTSALTPGTDTNLILYDDSRNGINGSDDIGRATGDLSSAVSYYVTYEGWLYALVGQGFAVPQNLEGSYSYQFECGIGPLATDVPTSAPPPPGPPAPTRTPRPVIPTDTSTPTITPTPTPPFIQIHAQPTATPPGLALTQIPVSLQVYYDADGNNKPDPGEGVSGVSARVFDLVTGNLLAQGFTDDTGRVTFTVSAPGAVHLVVPYFNFSTIILPSGGSAVIRISPRILPQSIP